jgi:ElaB/YqjD/DUF883 family membrane-anchored ribosome-binding protein
MEATGKLESALNSTSSALMSGGVDPINAGQSAQKNRQPPMDRPALERMTSTAHQAVDKIAYAAHQAAGTLDEKSRQIRETQVELADTVGHYVREHPGTSLGIAVATGFLIRHLISLR